MRWPAPYAKPITTMPSLRDLLRAFDRHKLTSRALTEIGEALDYTDLATDPPFETVDADDQITIRRTE